MPRIVINLLPEVRKHSFLDTDFECLGKLGELVSCEAEDYGNASLGEDLYTADAMLMGRGGWLLREEL